MSKFPAKIELDRGQFAAWLAEQGEKLLSSGEAEYECPITCYLSATVGPGVRASSSSFSVWVGDENRDYDGPDWMAEFTSKIDNAYAWDKITGLQALYVLEKVA